MHKKSVNGIAFVGLMVLAGCGGGGGNGGTDPVEPGTNVTQLRNDFDALSLAVLQANDMVSQDLQTTGSITYEGIMTIDVESYDAAMQGTFNMTIGFAGDGEIGGMAMVFLYHDDRYSDTDALPSVAGTVDFSNGSIRRTDDRVPTFNADFAGTLAIPVDALDAPANTDIVVAGDLVGQIRVGAIAAGFTFDTATPAGAAPIEINGELVALEQ